MDSFKLPRNSFVQQLKKKLPLVFEPWKVVLFFALSISCFLFLFEPFGFGTIPLNLKAYWISVHGICSIMVLGFNVHVMPRVFKKLFLPANWTRLKHGFWFIWNVFTVGSANYLLSQWIQNSDILFSSDWIQFLMYSGLLASIPVGFLLLLTRIKELKSKTIIAEKDSGENTTLLAEKQVINLLSENRKQCLSFEPEHLVYIESNKNYLKICLLKEQKLKLIKFRNTLKNVEAQLSHLPFVKKVHRAFLVQVDHIEKVQRKDHAYKLRFKDLEEEVPISRTYIQQIKSILKQ